LALKRRLFTSGGPQHRIVHDVGSALPYGGVAIREVNKGMWLQPFLIHQMKRWVEARTRAPDPPLDHARPIRLDRLADGIDLGGELIHLRLLDADAGVDGDHQITAPNALHGGEVITFPQMTP